MRERSHAEKTIGLARLEHGAQGFQLEVGGRVGGPYRTPSARTRLKQSCVLAGQDFEEGRRALESGQDRGYLRNESGVRQCSDGVEVIQVVHQLLRAILCAQRGHDAPEPCDRKERRDERRRVGQQQGNALARLPKGRLEGARECLRPTEQVSKRYFAIALADGYSSSSSGPSAVQRIRKHQLGGHLESRSPTNAASDPTVSRWRISRSLSSMVSPNASSTALITCSISMESSPIPPPRSTVSSPISSLGVTTPEPLVITSTRRRSTAAREFGEAPRPEIRAADLDSGGLRSGTILAGLPATVTPSGNDFITTAFGPTRTLSPIRILPRILAPVAATK